MVNAVLAVTAVVWVYRRNIVELAGIALIVLAAALFDPILGILAGGIALIVAANFSSRT